MRVQHTSGDQPSAASATSRVGQSDDWIRALEAFGIAYFCFPDRGDPWMSTGALHAISQGLIGEAVVQQAYALGRSTLVDATWSDWRTEPFLAAQVQAGTTRVSLSVYTLLNGTRTRLVVILVQFRHTASVSELGESGLTPREREVAEMIATGKATKEIAGTLAISQHTARHHTERVFQKLGLRSRAAVAAAVAAHRLPARAVVYAAAE